MTEFEFEECSVATDGSEIWRMGVRFVPVADDYQHVPQRTMLGNNPSCQHRSIDNGTWHCEACGEAMIRRLDTPLHVKSAPNAAAGQCANGPDCDGGEGCTAVYVPDLSQERDVLIGTDVTYGCQRCSNNGTVMSADAPIEWACGQSHHGARIPASTTARSE